MKRRRFLVAGAALGAGVAFDPSLVYAQGASTLRVAMTASDVPIPNGQTDQGAEGMRFVGYTIFDRWLPYVTGGLAYGGREVTAGRFSADETSIGWTIGIGVDYAINQMWTVSWRPSR